MSIAAGRLNRRITLLEPVTTLSPAHEAVVTLEPFQTVWAEVKQQTADEVQQDGQIVARVKYIIVIRYLAEVAESWQIEFNDKQLTISAVVSRGRDEEMEITAHEVR